MRPLDTGEPVAPTASQQRSLLWLDIQDDPWQ